VVKAPWASFWAWSTRGDSELQRCRRRHARPAAARRAGRDAVVVGTEPFGCLRGRRVLSSRRKGRKAFFG
jgi:hypothetical protein